MNNGDLGGQSGKYDQNCIILGHQIRLMDKGKTKTLESMHTKTSKFIPTITLKFL